MLGAAAFEAAEEWWIKILKDEDYNAIRSSHNPLSVAMLNVCDRYGMYVMDELDGYRVDSKEPGGLFQRISALVRKDLEVMIDNAIASWSWAGCEGKPVVIEVFFDADQVELFINARSLGKKKLRKMKAFFKTRYIPIDRGPYRKFKNDGG